MSWKVPAPWSEALDSAPAARLFGLSPRLARVALSVPEGALVADVGADHGQLAAALLRSGRSPYVWAVDLSELALDGARSTLALEVRRGTATVLLGDGLDPIPPHGGDAGPVGCLAIAGTGAQTALGIVERAWAKGHRPETVILQPSASEVLVRSSMLEFGYGLVEEHVVKDGKRLFIVLVFRLDAGVRELRSGVDRFVGPFLAADPGPAVSAWLQVQVDWLGEKASQSDSPTEREACGERLAALHEALERRGPGASVNAH